MENEEKEKVEGDSHWLNSSIDGIGATERKYKQDVEAQGRKQQGVAYRRQEAGGRRQEVGDQRK